MRRIPPPFPEIPRQVKAERLARWEERRTTSAQVWAAIAVLMAGLVCVLGVLMLFASRPSDFRPLLIGLAFFVISLPYAIYQDVLRRRRVRNARKWHCVHCGYDVRENTERCPECGRIIYL